MNCRNRCPWVRACSCVGDDNTDPATCDTAIFLEAYWQTIDRMNQRHDELEMQHKFEEGSPIVGA